MTGICFGLGIYGAVLLLEGDAAPSERELETAQLPPGLVIEEHSRVDGTPYFTIRGVVANSGTENWQRARLTATIKAGEAAVNECDTVVRGGIKPGARRAFLVECYGVAGTNTPDNLRYEILVQSAGR